LELDIRKLQRAIVDGLEDVKAQDIVVFNTEHLSPLFERVVVATGSSNRQTKALASSVRESVKARGLPVLATEGEDNGEWIIVDCGAAVVHIMQPGIREYYHLEEIWGGKTVRMKAGVVRTGLVKASEPMDEPVPAATRSAARRKPPAAAGDTAAPAKAGARSTARSATRTAPAKTPAKRAARPAAADVPPSRARRRSTPAVQTVVVKPSGQTSAKAGARGAAKTATKTAARTSTKAPARSAARPAKASPRAPAKPRASRG